MENLNAEAVKKGLEYCKAGKCHNGCPLFYFCEDRGALAGSSKLCGDALALINSQEQRIKELAEKNERLQDEADRYKRYYFNHEYDKFEAEVRADTVRKMHSEIKERCIKGGIFPAFVASTIDQIAKEMLEGVCENTTN